MKYIIISLSTLKVFVVGDYSLLRDKASTDFVELEVNELPDGCMVGSDASIEIASGNWTFTAPNHRIKAKAAIHSEHDFDHVNLDAIDALIGCITEIARAVHQDQVADSPLAISLNKCVKELDAIKNRVTKRKRENEVIHALVGGDTTASSQALLSLSADTINATIKLVQQVSTDYGAAGLNLLELHFNNSLHFDADGNIVLPLAAEFEGANGTPTPEPTNQEE